MVPVSILDQDFEQKIETLPHDEARASLMEHALRAQIKERVEENPVFYERLSEALERIIRELRARLIDAAEGCKRLAALLERALRWYRTQGLVVEEVMTDNGSAYRSRAWRERCQQLGLRHLRTRPYTPRTNGKAERFIQTLLRSWAYGFAYPSSACRTRALAGWTRWYNRRRPHGSLGGLPPVSRVSHVCGHYS